MQSGQTKRFGSNRQRGMTLFMVAACLVVLLGMSALAIDLAYLYVTRSEAQRTADGAVLAAAKRLAEDLITNGLPQNTAEANARAEAQFVGTQNLVGGQAAVIADNDVVFDFSVSNNPRVSVRVQRTTVAGNPGPMPTFFAKAIGFNTVDVAAVATAEAYTQGPGGPVVCVGCLKPWILPNCDPNPLHAELPQPPNCPLGRGRFVDETTGAVRFPTPYDSGIPPGVIGQPIVVKPGDPHDAPIPGQFYPIQLPPGTTPSVCPDCASQPGGSEGPGGALYRHNISCCNTNQFYCGQGVLVDEQTGNMQGPTKQGVQCLIHEENNGSGQDTLIPTSPFQLRIRGGSNNPNPALQNVDNISGSDSLVTLPLYDGHQLTSGESGGTQFITIVGFMQLFVEQVTLNGSTQGDVNARIIHVSGCGGGGGGPAVNCGGSGTVGGGSPIPVRLIQTPANMPVFPPPPAP